MRVCQVGVPSWMTWSSVTVFFHMAAAILCMTPPCAAQGVPDTMSTFTSEETSLTPEQAEELSRQHTTLTLAALENLSPEVAAALAKPRSDELHGGADLILSALRRLDADAARQLARYEGSVSIPVLESISAEAAEALVSHPGVVLRLDGVQELSPEVARALTKTQRIWLYLGIKSLPLEIADILADCNSHLSFTGIDSVSIESARALVRHRRSLDFGKARITPEVAEVLLDHQGLIGVSLAKRLEPGVGDILARHKFDLGLSLEEIDSVALARKLFSGQHHSSSVTNLRTMSPGVAAEYARLEPGYLKYLNSLSVEAARELAGCRHDVTLPALDFLSPELAKALTDREPAMYLPGMKVLDGPDAEAIAEALASTPGPVYLEFLERISAPALAALRKKPTITIPPDEKLTIVPE
jgi:hypothetical protein